MEFIDDYLLDGGYFEDGDAKLINQSSHFGGKMGWKSDAQLDKMFTNLALKAN
jgi:hypothetical protein